MFRIVQFKIPDAKVEQWVESESVTFGRFSECAGEMSHHKGFWYSPPMSTTSARFFMCEQFLRSLVGDPPHLIEDLTANYRLLRTRAPQVYDYGYVIEIGKMQGEFGEERLVAMPKESVDYQSGRYASGMYSPIDCR
jgi:hypothetical protein